METKLIVSHWGIQVGTEVFLSQAEAEAALPRIQKENPGRELRVSTGTPCYSCVAHGDMRLRAIEMIDGTGCLDMGCTY